MNSLDTKFPKYRCVKKKKKKEFLIVSIFIAYFSNISLASRFIDYSQSLDKLQTRFLKQRSTCIQEKSRSLSFIHRSCNALNLLWVLHNPGNWSRYRYKTKNNFNGTISSIHFLNGFWSRKVKSLFVTSRDFNDCRDIKIRKDLHFFDFTLIFVCTLVGILITFAKDELHKYYDNNVKIQ